MPPRRPHRPAQHPHPVTPSHRTATAVSIDAPMTTSTRWVHLPLLLLLGGLLFFINLGALGLTDRDEGSNAEAAREMVESGDWMSPTLNYEPRFAKPAFTYWIMSGFYHLFGVNEFSARVHAAVFGLLLLGLHYVFLSRVKGPWFALVGSLMLALNIEMVAISRVALTDSVLIFFTTLALYGFWLGMYGTARQAEGQGPDSVVPAAGTDRAIWLLYLGMAFATLTKGPVGLLVPLLAIAAYLSATGGWKDFWQRGRPLAGTALTVALAVPWYLGMLLIHGERYSTSAQADTVGRFFSMIGGHGGTVLFYVPILLFGFFPWSGFALVGLWQTVTAWRARRRAAAGPITSTETATAPDLELFAAAWLIAVFLFFSLSSTRLPHYIGPLFPAAAILAAAFWHRVTSAPSGTRVPGVSIAFSLFAVTGYVLGFALLSAPMLYDTFVSAVEREFPLARQFSVGVGPIAAGGLLVAGTALAHLFGRSEDKRPGAFWIAATSLTLALLMIFALVLPRFHEDFISPPQTLATIAGFNLGPNDQFVTYGPHKPSWIFYARRKTLVIRPGEEEKLKVALAHPSRTMILLPTKLRDKLPPETAAYEVLLERKGYSLIANEPIVKLPPKPAAPSRPSIPEHAFPRDAR